MSEGAKLARERFPFGTGLATFATPFADDAGVYQRTAIAQTFFLARGTGLFDSNMASILGETGLIGLAFVGLLFWFVVDRAVRAQGWLVRIPLALNFFILFNFEALMQNAVSAAGFALFLAVRAAAPADREATGTQRLF